MIGSSMGWMKLLEEDKEKSHQYDKLKKEDLKVLVIDDEVHITNALGRYLQMENYNVITAQNGRQGFEKYLNEKPHIVITDIKMPGMSGLDLLSKIRENDSDTEVVVITGHGDMDSAVTALKNQASDFISKPIDFDVIVMALERSVDRLSLKQKIKSYTAELEELLRQVNSSKRYMETIVRNSPNAIVSYDHRGKIISWNAEAERITGYNAGESIGKTLSDIFLMEGNLIDFDEEQIDENDLQNVVVQILTRQQELRYISRNANVLRDQDNKIAGGIESFVDITEQVKNDRLLEKRYLQVQMINEVGKKVASSKKLDDLLQFVTEHMVKTFFESSQVVVFIHDPEKKKLILRALAGYRAERVRGKFPVGTEFRDDEGVIGKVFRSGEADIINDVTTCPYFFSASLPEVASEFAFPIRSKDNIYGVLNIENTEQMQLDESDRFLLEAVAEYLGISVERIELLERITQQNQLLEKQAGELREALDKVGAQKEIIEEQNTRLIKDLQKAGDFQKSLLPEKLPEFENIKFAASYTPSSQLGGDLYDIFEVNEDLIGVLVADASGHGVASAMLSAMFKMTLEKHARQITKPAEVLSLMNKDFCQVLQMGEFFTAFYALYDRKRKQLTYGNAGHPKPLLYNYETGEITELDTEGFLLGVMEDGISYEEKSINLAGRYRLLIYTDGVNEAADQDDNQYGNERIVSRLRDGIKQRPDTYLERIRTDVARFTGSDVFEDDVTLVVMDIR